jgi:hypothetical protein
LGAEDAELLEAELERMTVALERAWQSMPMLCQVHAAQAGVVMRASWDRRVMALLCVRCAAGGRAGVAPR